MIVQVPINVHPRQIDFGQDVERSKPGALYFVPGTTKTITDDEMEFLKKNHKRFASMLVVLQASKPKPVEKKSSVVEPTKAKDKMSQAKLRAQELLKKKVKQPVVPVVEVVEAPIIEETSVVESLDLPIDDIQVEDFSSPPFKRKKKK